MFGPVSDAATINAAQNIAFPPFLRIFYAARDELTRRIALAPPRLFFRLLIAETRALVGTATIPSKLGGIGDCLFMAIGV
jgi:hypothetical protein